MPSQKNQQQLDIIREKAQKAKSVVVTDFSGLTVTQQTKLRAALKEAGGEYIVGKNTLLRIALNNKELDSQLQGQSGVLFSYADEITPIKALAAFIKEVEKPLLKVGLLAGKILSVQDIKEYAKLPGKNELIVMLMQSIQGPTYGLLNVMQAGMRNLVYALKAVEQKQVKA